MGTTALVFSNEDLNDKTKIVEEFLGESDLLIKGVGKTIKNEEKEQTSGFIDTLLGTLGASLLGNMLAGKEVVRGSNRWWWSNKSWWRTRFVMPAHPSANYEIQKYQNEPRFNEIREIIWGIIYLN